jgi:hypothetical protein
LHASQDGAVSPLHRRRELPQTRKRRFTPAVAPINCRVGSGRLIKSANDSRETFLKVRLY